MTTQKELLEAHREELQKQWHEKHPLGLFSVQIREYGQQISYAIHWEINRRTSHVNCLGISLKVLINNETNIKTYSCDSGKNCCFGKNYYADTLDDIERKAIRHHVPVELIDAFKRIYNKKQTFADKDKVRVFLRSLCLRESFDSLEKILIALKLS